jgi:hypothetical protein
MRLEGRSMGNSVFDKMKSGELARLNPTVPDSKKEERATSILLATFRAVPDFARAMLSDAGISFPKTSQIECYTEVALEIPDSKRAVRPDGLIVLTKGKKQWLAFVESKTGSSQLKQEQCEEYLVLARQLGIDAVVTISNQYSAIPTHHPVSVSKTKTRKVGLLHFSWLSLMSKATLLTESRAVEDPEQAFLLQELVRFLKHPYSGVSSFTRMPKSWSTLCASVKQGLVLRKKDPDINEAVVSWHQLIRFLALELTTRVGQPVQVKLSRRHTNDPSTRVVDDIDGVVKHSRLNSELLIPNAASSLAITADLKRRTLNLSMRLKAPSNKKRATAPINWLIRQLKNVEREDLLIRAVWPRRIPDTTATIGDVRDDPNCIVHEGVQELPQSLEVVRVIDLAGKFSGVKTFIEYASSEVPNFYKDVGEHLRAWVPPPPKMKRTSAPDHGDETNLRSDPLTSTNEQPYTEERKATDNRSLPIPVPRDV